MKKTKIFPTVVVVLSIIVVVIFLNFYSGEDMAKQQGDTNIKIGMGYIPNVQFAPFYVAQEKGYYDNVGINPEFDYAMSPDLLKLLGQNQLDFVIASGDEVVLAVDKEVPISYVMSLYSRFPVTIVSLDSKQIKTPQDLIGKKIGLPGFYGSSYIALQAFLHNNNLNENDLNLEAIGYTQVQAVSEDTVDGAVAFSMNEPVQLKNLGHNINTIEFSDYIDFTSAGIVTSNKNIQDKPDLVQNFVKATYKAMQDIENDPENSFITVRKYVDMDDDQAKVQYKIMLKTIDFWKNSNGELTNEINKKTWENTVKVLQQSDLINTEFKATSAYDDSFID